MKQVFVLSHPTARKNAMTAVSQAPDGYLVEIRQKTRTLEQNAKLWSMLSEISNQVEWYGKKLSEESWKDIFSAVLRKQEVVPGIDGGFVVLGQSTRKMTIAEMSDMIELIHAFGAERDIVFWDSKNKQP